MLTLDRFYTLLRRKTNTTTFIPQVDGLRFVAIAMVLLYHINIFVTNKVPFEFSQSPKDFWWIFQFLDTDRKGVFLFFVISGFVLALPFAKAAKMEGKPVVLKSYFFRRLTRLEPPYFLTMTASFLGILFLKGHEFTEMFSKSFSGLLPSFAASLAYMHNIIFPENLSINPIAWSLEIEIQFYLLVPLFVLVFKLPKTSRRILLIAAIVGFIYLQQLFKPGIYTLFSYIHYFLLGFLLVDLYLAKYEAKINTWLSLVMGFLCLAFIGYVDLYSKDYWEYIFVAVIFIFYVLALTNEIWKKIFNLRLLTAIGGMCYSIYLIHYNIISLVGNKTIAYNVSNTYPITYFWHAIILLPIVLLFSTCFYLLVERPCMDKEWPAKLWAFIKRYFSRQKPQPPLLEKGT